MKALNKGNIHGARRYQEGGITPMVQRTADQVTLPQSNQGLMAQTPTISTKPIGTDMNVAELWQHVTGTPWSEAHNRHLTDGYAQSNMELRAVLLGDNPLETLKSIEQAAQAEEAQPVQPATALPQKETTQPAQSIQVPDSPRVLANKSNQSFPSRQQQAQPDSTQQVPATDNTQVAPAADSTGMPGPLVPSQVIAPGGQGGNWGSTALNIGGSALGIGTAGYYVMKGIKKIKAAKLAKAEGKPAPVEKVKTDVAPETVSTAEVKSTVEPAVTEEALATSKAGKVGRQTVDLTPGMETWAKPQEAVQPSPNIANPARNRSYPLRTNSNPLYGPQPSELTHETYMASPARNRSYPLRTNSNPMIGPQAPQWVDKSQKAVTSFPEVAAEAAAPTKTTLVAKPKPKVAPRKSATPKAKPTTEVVAKELAPNTTKAAKGAKKVVSKAGEQTSFLGDLEGVVSKLGKKGGEAINAVGAKGKAILGSSEAKSVEKAIGEAVVGILKKIR